MINSSITPDPKAITKQTGVSKYAASNTSEGAQLFSDRGTLTAASPERHQRVIAKPDEVVTSFRLLGIIGGVMLHDPIAMVCTATNTVRLYVSITVNRRSLLEDRRGVNKWFTPNLNRHISHPAAPYISPRYVGVVGAHRQHQPSSWTGCKNTRGHFWPKSPMWIDNLVS